MNTISLNINGTLVAMNIIRDAPVYLPSSPPGGDIPVGYEAFLVSEGVFSASDGAYYVKL